MKPLKRKNAVKLLSHIYEELHPLVTDSESSFSETPQRVRPGKIQPNKSPAKSPACSSSSMQNGSSSEDENDQIAELDRQHSAASSKPTQNSSLSINDQLKKFLNERQDIYKMVTKDHFIPVGFLLIFALLLFIADRFSLSSPFHSIIYTRKCENQVYAAKLPTSSTGVTNKYLPLNFLNFKTFF